jgi:hypothetical protein
MSQQQFYETKQLQELYETNCNSTSESTENFCASLKDRHKSSFPQQICRPGILCGIGYRRFKHKRDIFVSDYFGTP